jgi:hypothetical protein
LGIDVKVAANFFGKSASQWYKYERGVHKFPAKLWRDMVLMTQVYSQLKKELAE